MRLRPTAALLLAAAVFAFGRGAPAAAAVFRGVTFPDAVAIGGRECRLNGVGVRTKFLVKVYLGALYLATPTGDAAAAVAADEPKRVVMHFVRTPVGADKIREALVEGVRANAAAELPRLQERLDRFVSWIDADVADGDEVVLTYVPGRGTEALVKGRERGVIAGADFMRALWSVWLGARPGDAELKRALLGQP